MSSISRLSFRSTHTGPTQRAAFACKQRQVEAAGAEALVNARANCRNVLEEAIEQYGMTLPVLGLTELVARYLEPESAATVR